MQNRYAGDTGDFGKIGLLRSLARSGLKVGVNWYLVPDETHNDDGKHIGYLRPIHLAESQGIIRKSLDNVTPKPT